MLTSLGSEFAFRLHMVPISCVRGNQLLHHNMGRKLLHISKAVPRNCTKYENIRQHIRMRSFSCSCEIDFSDLFLLLEDIVLKYITFYTDLILV